MAYREQARRPALHGVMLHYDAVLHVDGVVTSEVATVVVGVVELEFDLIAAFAPAQVDAETESEHVPVVADRSR